MDLPLMDESINLDEDGAFSPQTMQSPGTAANSLVEPSPLAGDPTPPGVPEAPLEPVDPARILAEAKSMENILLESADTGSDQGGPLTPAPATESPPPTIDESVPEPSPPASEVENAGQVSPTGLVVPAGQSPTLETGQQVPATGPQLSSYFGSPTGQTGGEAASFFDHLTEGTAATSPPAADPGGAQQPGEVVIRERTLSVASEEATPVSFEEVKGSGLKFVGSMESVTKFFNESTGDVMPEESEEGKEFFDSFTAGATGDLATGQPPAPSADGLPGPTSPPMAMPGAGSLPPETPPIPLEPMSMSPLPSPIHTGFIRQRSISQSQASPAPSPIHTTVTTGNSDPTPDSLPTSDPADSILQSAFSNTGGTGGDAFTTGLSMSDADRRHDAWIPTETTRQILVSMVTSTPGAYVVMAEQLTTPGVSPSDPLGDPVQELVQRFMGEAEANKRITLTVDDVPEDAEGLRKLISAECWRSAADLTAKLLEAYGQGVGGLGQTSKHSPQSLQMWFCRMALLVKLRLYTTAETECQSFGNLDRPDLYYEYYADAYPGRRGSMVPFAFRILHAELPQYLGKSQESLDRLYYVQAITKKILTNLESGLSEDGSMIQLSDESRKASYDLWSYRQVQLEYAIGNCLLSNKDYSMAIEIFEGLLKSDEQVKKEDILCGIGRIYLQMGDVKTAQRYFSQAETASDATNPVVKCRNLMNKGFVALGQNLFSEAYNYFKQATTLNPENAVAVNNMAVCSLYMGRLRDALTTLESLVHEDPVRYLQEGILFNLCTLYELESSRALHKKQALLQLVSKHKGNGFNTACLKMT